MQFTPSSPNSGGLLAYVGSSPMTLGNKELKDTILFFALPVSTSPTFLPNVLSFIPVAHEQIIKFRGSVRLTYDTGHIHLSLLPCRNEEKLQLL